jgi:hypothetical protein
MKQGLSKEEQQFITSISDKITKYNIDTTLEECLTHLSGNFQKTRYNDKTTETVDVEIEKFIINKSVHYFIKKYSVISLPGKGYVPFDTYYVQDCVLSDYLKYKKNIILKTRQAGISTVTSLYALWIMLNEDSLEHINIISKTEKGAKEFKKNMNPTLERIPLFLLPKLFDKKTGEYRYLNSLSELELNNRTELQFPNGSKFKCETASENAGRGDAISLLILDEAAFFKTRTLPYEIWKSAGPTLAKTKGQAIIISTPAGMSSKGEWYYKQWVSAKNGDGVFHPITIDWWEMPDEDKGNTEWLIDLVNRDYYYNEEVREEGEQRAKYEERNSENNKWLNEQRKTQGEIGYKQEILHDFISTGESIFSTEVLAKIKKKIKSPILKDMLKDEPCKGLWIWQHPEPKKKYLIGVDPSRGTGRDPLSIQVFDYSTYTQVAECKGFLSTKRIGIVAKKLARYYNDAYLIIECNGYGQAVFEEVYNNDTDPYSNVYKRIIKKQGQTITIGWDTTPENRRMMTDEFINFLQNDSMLKILNIYSERLYNELTTWIWDGGKAIHADGMHDDAILAFCLVLYNRNKYNKSDNFILGTEENVDYGSFDEDDIQMIKEKKMMDEDDLTFDEMMEERKKDYFIKTHGVDFDDYKWLLGF